MPQALWWDLLLLLPLDACLGLIYLSPGMALAAPLLYYLLDWEQD